jgi:hypothetical protein
MKTRQPTAAKTCGGSQQKSVLKQIDELNRMSMDQLRKRWKDLFGTDSGRMGRSYLIRRLAYRIQELVYGGLSREARQKLAAIADGDEAKSKEPPRKRQAANLQPGTRLLRDWHGERYEVVVQEDGFLYDGKMYRSLSAVARAITGSYWSGNRFFGLTPNSKKKGLGA